MGKRGPKPKISHPLLDEILKQYDSLTDFCYINSLDRSKIYHIMRGKTYYLHKDTLFDLSFALGITQERVRELCMT